LIVIQHAYSGNTKVITTTNLMAMYLLTTLRRSFARNVTEGGN
jgi:hypothetical protein